MCYFLAAGVPAEHGWRLRDAFTLGYTLVPVTNAAMVAAFPTGYEIRLVTTGTCSCDLYVRPGSAGPADARAHLRRKYAKRGWSDARIARAVEQAMKDRPGSAGGSGLRRDVVDRLWLLCRAAGEVAVVVHWYHGDIDTEPLSPTRAPPCRCNDFPSWAAGLNEDEVLHAAA
jgi:hypothetical protein